MAAVRAKCTANVAEPDLRLSCTVTVPMCAKPIAGSAGLFGVHFAFTVDVQTKIKPFYSGKKVQSKPTTGTFAHFNLEIFEVVKLNHDGDISALSVIYYAPTMEDMDTPSRLRLACVSNYVFYTIDLPA